MRKKIIFTPIFILIIIASCICLGSCNRHDVLIPVDYALDNHFEVGVTDTESQLIFEPISSEGKKIDYKYGIVFYLGTMIDATYYEYLGNALAAQGYIVIMPKLLFAYAQYQKEETAFENFPNVRFFIGGHSQGGGACIRRAQECIDSVIGAILYSPLAYRHQLTDENGEPVVDENGVEIYIKDDLSNSQLPVLLLEAANDNVLTADMKADAKSRLNEDRTINHTIAPGSHMSFSTMDTDEILSLFNNDGDGITQSEKEEQRRLTLIYTLAFMQSVVLG